MKFLKYIAATLLVVCLIGIASAADLSGSSSGANFALVLSLSGNLTPFADGSQHATAATRNGNVTIGPGPGGMGSNGNAIYFDGINGDYISIPSTNINFSSNSYTISAIVNPQSLFTNIIDANGFNFGIKNNILTLTTTNASATTMVNGGNIPEGSWSYVAAIKNSTYITLVSNGTVLVQTSISSAYTAPVSGNVEVGQ
jgi:hypothetical protein